MQGGHDPENSWDTIPFREKRVMSRIFRSCPGIPSCFLSAILGHTDRGMQLVDTPFNLLLTCLDSLRNPEVGMCTQKKWAIRISSYRPGQRVEVGREAYVPEPAEPDLGPRMTWPLRLMISLSKDACVERSYKPASGFAAVNVQLSSWPPRPQEATKKSSADDPVIP